MKAIIVNAAVFQVGWLCCVLAGAGPAAYFTGYKLGGVQIPEFTNAMTALALGWAVFMPFLMLLSNRLDGTSYQAHRLIDPGYNARV